MLRSTLTAAGTWLRPAPLMRSRSALGAVLLAIATTAGIHRPPCTCAADPASSESSKPIRRLPSKEVNGDLVTVRGQVLTPDGRPAAGATVGVFGPVFRLDVPKRPSRRQRAEPTARSRLPTPGSHLRALSAAIGGWR